VARDRRTDELSNAFGAAVSIAGVTKVTDGAECFEPLVLGNQVSQGWRPHQRTKPSNSPWVQSMTCGIVWPSLSRANIWLWIARL
jgi:hypothetical protein